MRSNMVDKDEDEDDKGGDGVVIFLGVILGLALLAVLILTIFSFFA